jgi:hypothetical protein
LSAGSLNLVGVFHAGVSSLGYLQYGGVIHLPMKIMKMDPWDEKEWWIMIACYYRQALG